MMTNFSSTKTAALPNLKFADTTLEYFYQGMDRKDPWYKSNIWIKCRSKFGEEDYFSPLFIIYSYIQDCGVRVWGLSSPKFENPKFYNDYETAFKWAHKFFDSMEITEDFEVHKSYPIKWYTNHGTRKCPVWEEHRKTAFFFDNPAYTY